MKKLFNLFSAWLRLRCFTSGKRTSSFSSQLTHLPLSKVHWTFFISAMVCGLGMSVLAQNFYTMTFDMDGDTLRIATWLHGDSEYRGNDYVLLSQSAKILTVDDDDTVPYRRSLYSTLEASNAIEVLNRAIEEHGKPEIVNSDQGSQYTCQKWTDTLEEKRIAISMDGRGRCRDNAWIERFWRTLKTEYVNLNPWSEAA